MLRVFMSWCISLCLVTFLICPSRAQPPVEVSENPERVCPPDGKTGATLGCIALPTLRPSPAPEKASPAANGFHESEAIAGQDEEWGEGLYIFSGVHDRSGGPYLAFAPVAGLQTPQSWKFFTGRGLSGSINWVDFERWQSHIAADGLWDPGDHAKLFSESRACGGIQVEWNAPLARFLMLYLCDNGTSYVRVAQRASGPWSEATPFARLAGMTGLFLMKEYDSAGPTETGSRSTILTWEVTTGHDARREFYRTTVRQQGAQ